jgi:hypothetical protein
MDAHTPASRLSSSSSWYTRISLHGFHHIAHQPPSPLQGLASAASAAAEVDVDDSASPASGQTDISFLGSMLFTRCVSGTRVVVPSTARGGGKDPTAKTIGPLTFPGYGSHADAYPPGPYLTAACALGVSRGEIEEFLKRLDKAMGDFARRRQRRQQRGAGRGGGAGTEGEGGGGGGQEEERHEAETAK